MDRRRSPVPGNKNSPFTKNPALCKIRGNPHRLRRGKMTCARRWTHEWICAASAGGGERGPVGPGGPAAGQRRKWGRRPCCTLPWSRTGAPPTARSSGPPWAGPRSGFAAAFQALESQGLVGLPQGQAPLPRPAAGPRRPPGGAPGVHPGRHGPRPGGGGVPGPDPGRWRRSWARSSPPPDVGTLLGLYDYVGLPSDVIFLLVGYCCERTAQRYGPRPPAHPAADRAGGLHLGPPGASWTRTGPPPTSGTRQRQREALPRLMALLRLGDRPASPSEEKYLLSLGRHGL